MAKRKKRPKGETTIYKALHRKLKTELSWTPLKTRGESRCSERVSNSCMWHPSCCSCYKLSDKSWRSTGPDCAYNKWNISVVILVKVNQVMVATVNFRSDHFKLSTSYTSFISFIVSSASIKVIVIGTTSSGISDKLRDIYSINRCCWNVAIYKWKVGNWSIEIISFIAMFDI